MSDAIKPWTEAWAASQQAFFKGVVPTRTDADAASLASGDAAATVQQQFVDLQSTWKESIEKWTAYAKETSGQGVPTADQLQAMFAPARWNGQGAGAFETNLQHVIEGPKYATLGDLERKLAVLQKLLIARNREVAAYQAIVQRAWNTAMQRFTESFRSATVAPPATWRATTDRWLATANEVLIETYRTDEFIEAQSRMLRAASDYRLQEREIAEAWCEAWHIPTRTEMDEMQRGMTELRRRVRTLEREATQTSRAAAATAAPKASRTPARRRRGTDNAGQEKR